MSRWEGVGGWVGGWVSRWEGGGWVLGSRRWAKPFMGTEKEPLCLQ